MKHILNNLTEQEKNAIREQHAGGMKVMTENFSKLTKAKLGDVKTINEQMDVSSDSEHYEKRKREVMIPYNQLSMLAQFASEFCRGKEAAPDCKEVRRIVNQYQLFM
jgi:hypothetical protein